MDEERLDAYEAGAAFSSISVHTNYTSFVISLLTALESAKMPLFLVTRVADGCRLEYHDCLQEAAVFENIGRLIYMPVRSLLIFQRVIHFSLNSTKS